MIELVRHLAVVCAIGFGLSVPAWADEPLHGQVIGVVGGDIITLVDARQREHQLRLAFIDAPVPGQPFADEAQTALSAMVLGRQVTAQILGKPLQQDIERRAAVHCARRSTYGLRAEVAAGRLDKSRDRRSHLCTQIRRCIRFQQQPAQGPRPDPSTKR